MNIERVSIADTKFRPFYFTVVFWGRAYREFFTDLLLASLLSPNNIPALRRERQSKFLIVTTKNDWDAVQEHGLFQELQEYVDPIWFEMAYPNADDLKMLVMSRGHKVVAQKAFEDKAYGVFVTPDLILSDGSVAAMEALAEMGKKVVLSVALRFGYESLLPKLEKEGYLVKGKPLAIPPRDLMRLGLPSFHSETLRYEYEKPYFADMPISIYWWVPDGNGVIIHSFSWAPLVLDYGSLYAHDSETFEKWTLDGDYVFRNFPDPKDVYVVTDSDEIMLVSFTKETDLHFDLEPSALKKHQVIGPMYKTLLVRALLNSQIMDPLKRKIFKAPVFLHWDELKKTWVEKQQEVSKIIDRAYSNQGKYEAYLMKSLVILSGNSSVHIADWLGVRRLKLFFFIVWLSRQVSWHWKHRWFVLRRVLQKFHIVRKE